LPEKLRIIVSGMIAGDPGQGGAAWAVLQYVLGLRRFGHDVCLIEPLRSRALRPSEVALGSSQNAAYFGQVARDFGLEGKCSLILEGTGETVGLPYSEVRKFAGAADVLLNISGMLARPELIAHIPVRVYLDLDPVFNQLWHATQGIDMRFSEHNRFVTVGNAMGQPECRIPTCGLPWISTFQPVVLESWPRGNGIHHDGFTTVANWRGYGSVQHDGVFYGQKAHSLREFMDLPAKTSERFMLALSIHPDERKDLDSLDQNGWKLMDPAKVVDTPFKYREFVRGSKAELGIAKSGYVAALSGWFSDRSVCYLASGRPVIAQETGFSRFLPTGSGLFAFRSSDDILKAIAAIRRDYQSHSDAARGLAEEYFDSDKVLTRLLERIA
jgi:hypothetical protein